MTRPPDVVYFPTSGGLLSLSVFTGPVHYAVGFFYRGEGLSAKPTPGPRQSPATRVCRGEEERQNERALPPAAGRGIWRPRRRSLPHLPLLLPLIWAACIKKREDRRTGEITTERMPANQEGQVDFCLAAKTAELSTRPRAQSAA